MTAILLAPFAVVLTALYWIASNRRRRISDIEDILGSVDPEMIGRLNAMVDFSAQPSDRELWSAINGSVGLISIWKNTGIFVTALRELSRRHPERAESEFKEVWWTAVYLRLCVGGAIIERIARQWIPIPAVALRASTKLYCEVAATTEVVWSACQQLA